jgi:hypothetical protein
MEGYGIFWVLIETLRDQPGYKYPLSLIPALARRYNTTVQKMEAVIKGYGLFQFTENDFFYSQSLINRMIILEEKREIQRQKALKRWNNDATALPQHCHGNAEVMPVKESKVNKSKVKESKEDKNNKTALESAIDDFIEFRKKIKKPMTPKAVDLLKSKLDKLASDDETKILILNQSILNGWQTVYELKTNNTQFNTYQKPDKSNRTNFEQRDYNEDDFKDFFNNA